MKSFILFILFILLYLFSFAQEFIRIHADFSIKTKSADSTLQLSMGDVFYDTKHKKIVYRLKFPEKETWVICDTNVYKFINNQLKEKQKTASLSEFTVFHLALNGNLTDYGLKKSVYQIEKVEREGDLVITSWKPPKKLSKLLGKVLVSTKNKELFGVVIFNAQDSVVNKQFYKNYVSAGGVRFPTEVVSITYLNNKESYQITTFKNIKINEAENGSLYNHPLP